MPCTRVSPSTTGPRTKGQPSTGQRAARERRGSFFTSISPEGRRTATHRRVGAFIITPSITAWPPTLAGFMALTPARGYSSDSSLAWALASAAARRSASISAALPAYLSRWAYFL